LEVAHVSEKSVATPTTSVTAEVARIANLAWPVSVAQVGVMLLGVVDILMVGPLGEGALSGITLGHGWTFAVTVVLIGTAAGMDPLFAQAFGAGDSRRAGRALVRGGLLLGLLAVPVLIMHLLAGPLLTAAGQPIHAAALAGEYASVRALALLPLLGLLLLRQIIQGAGRMWPGAVAILVGNVVNVVINYGLVYGAFGFPELGPIGCAWASVISGWLMFAIILVLSLDLVRRCGPRLADVFPLSEFRRQAAVCLPVGLQTGLEGWGFSLATLFMGWMGERALAGHAVALTLSSLAYMLPLGISTAAATRVGNLLGAGHAWAKSAYSAIGLGAGVMAVCGATFILFSEALALPFVQQPGALAIAITLLPVAGAFALADGVQVVTFGVLRGAGDTAVPAAINIVAYYLVGLPVSLLLAFGQGFGPRGIWMGLASGLVLAAILLLLRLRTTIRRGGKLV
jgi:MATE family multidrug resistance protein